MTNAEAAAEADIEREMAIDFFGLRDIFSMEGLFPGNTGHSDDFDPSPTEPDDDGVFAG